MRTAASIILALTFIGLLVACNQDQGSNTSQLEGANQKSITQTTTSVDSPFAALDDLPMEDIRLPASNEVSGGLLLGVQEADNFDRLYFARFNGQPAQLLSDRVVSFRVTASPYDSWVAYPSQEGRSWHFMLTDLTTLETVQLADIEQDGEIHEWSPDGQWLSLHTSKEGLTVYNIPDKTRTQVLDQPSSSAWLDDNTLIYLKLDEQNSSTALMRYFPADNRHEMLLENIPANRPQNLIAFEAFLHNQGLKLANGFDQFDRTAIALDGQSRYVIDWFDAVWNGDVIICESWKITEYNLEGSPLNTVYEVDDSHFLTDLTLLENGDLLFLKWNINDCEFGNRMQVSLLKVKPSGVVNTITQDIYAGANRAVREHRYTVSNDGRFVFWIGNGETTETVINVTDLDTDITTTILAIDKDEFSTTIFENIIYIPE